MEMNKKNHISPLKPDGSKKTQYEIDTEKNILLNAYRRDNLVLNDRLFDICENVLPKRSNLIQSLKDTILKQQKEIESLKRKKSAWLF